MNESLSDMSRYNQNVITCLTSRVFVVNEYSRYRKFETYNNKFKGINDYVDTEQKGNVKYQSLPSIQTGEGNIHGDLIHF